MEPTTAKCCGQRRRTALLLLILLLSMTATAAQHVVVAYVTSWSSGLPDPTRMTHIDYAFGGVNSAGIGRVILRVEDVTTSVLLPQPEAHPLLHPWYTLDGIPVSAPVRPGIYIRNGKKVKNPVREESSRKRY